MPILENQRHELFAQEIAKGKSASEAYVNAGYRPSRKNASRLRTKEGIAARVVELQGVAARSAEITIESICRELDEANAVAKERGQASAMVSASTLRAKLAGLMVERVEVTNTTPGIADDASPEDIAQWMADNYDADRAVDLSHEQRVELVSLMHRWMQAVDDFFTGCRKTKPVHHDLAQIERKRLGLSNGGRR